MADAYGFTERYKLLLKRLKGYEPECHVVYFPVEGLYQAWARTRELGKMRSTRLQAVKDALGRIE